MNLLPWLGPDPTDPALLPLILGTESPGGEGDGGKLVAAGESIDRPWTRRCGLLGAEEAIVARLRQNPAPFDIRTGNWSGLVFLFFFFKSP